MDVQDLANTAPTSRIFHRTLMQALGKTIPHATADEWAEKWDAAREEFDSLNPRTPAEARLAAFAVAAMAGAMDSFERAARPGLSDEKAGRLRGSALAVGRFYKSVMLTLGKSANPAKPSRPASSSPAPAEPAAAPEDEPCPPGFIRLAPGAKPIKHHETFQPRDRYGKPIPTYRYQDMTPAQRRATYRLPRDKDLEAIAIAEEEAMIAEEAAKSTGSKSTGK